MELEDAGVDIDATNIPVTTGDVAVNCPLKLTQSPKYSTGHVVADGVPAAADMEAGPDVPERDVVANRVSTAVDTEARILVEPVV